MKPASYLTYVFAGALALANGARLSAATAPVPSPRPPNIVFILADDLGWNQVGYHGTSYYSTPNIDRIAREGMQFRQAYAAAPICSPSRAAIMTGKYPARLHLTDFIPSRDWEDTPLMAPKMQQGLPLEETTIPEMLHTRGYVSGLFGKWHLAPTYDYEPWRPLDPESQGFDEVYHTRKPEDAKEGTPDAHNAVSITDRAIAFIEHHKDEPFFCYVSHNVVHRPLMEEAELVAKYRAKHGANESVNNAIMGAMIERMDTGIGRVLETLERLHLEKNTVVIFMSDNGNVMADQSQAPFRGGKATVWEGGLRVPFAIRWPGVVASQSVSNEPVIGTDLFSTIMDICGVAYVPSLHDGVTLLPLLRGQVTTLKREALYWHYPHYHHLGDFRPGSVIRVGNYKLIEWYEGLLIGKGPTYSLFDVVADPGESHDLSGLEPDRAKAMQARLHAWRAHVGAQEMTVRETK